jgi:hypothetical protein
MIRRLFKWLIKWWKVHYEDYTDEDILNGL